MTKKKKTPVLEELLARPWCYYCERDFDDLKVLMSHQKAKHFKCDRCGRRLNTAGGLSVHLNQVHKENLDTVENALPNRANLNIEIFGMEGIPEEILQQHSQRVTAQFNKEQADRRAATGNPPPGSTEEGNPAKRPKLENASDLKARLAAFKAKKAGLDPASPQTPQSPGSVQTPPPSGSVYQAPLYADHRPVTDAPKVPSGVVYSPPTETTFNCVSHYSAFSAGPQAQASPQPFQNAPQYQTSAMIAEVPLSGFPPPRPSTLSPAPGLPSRPSFGAPIVNAQQLQQMHQGHYISPQTTRQAGESSDSGVASVPSSLPASLPLKPGDAAPAPEVGTEKKEKKEKTSQLVYEDNDVTPEEKRALLSRYSFRPY